MRSQGDWWKWIPGTHAGHLRDEISSVGYKYHSCRSGIDPLEYDALQLFIQSAKRVQADFRLDHSNIQDVVQSGLRTLPGSTFVQRQRACPLRWLPQPKRAAGRGTGRKRSKSCWRNWRRRKSRPEDWCRCGFLNDTHNFGYGKTVILSYSSPAPGTGTRTISMRPTSSAGSPHLEVHTKSVRRSGPPSIQANASVLTLT